MNNPRQDASTRPLRIFLANDHPIVRIGLCDLIGAQPDMEVVGQASDQDAVIHQCAMANPDIVILDALTPGLEGPGLSGAAMTERIRRDCVQARVVVLTSEDQMETVNRMLSAGAVAYILKRSPVDDLLLALRRVAADETYIDPAVAGHWIAGMMGHRLKNRNLSDREAEVVRMIAHGFMIKQIAGKLNVHGRTVETYKVRAMEKLGLKNRVDVMRYATRHGWLQFS